MPILFLLTVTITQAIDLMNIASIINSWELNITNYIDDFLIKSYFMKAIIAPASAKEELVKPIPLKTYKLINTVAKSTLPNWGEEPLSPALAGALRGLIKTKRALLPRVNAGEGRA